MAGYPWVPMVGKKYHRNAGHWANPKPCLATESTIEPYLVAIDNSHTKCPVSI